MTAVAGQLAFWLAVVSAVLLTLDTVISLVALFVSYLPSQRTVHPHVGKLLLGVGGTIALDLGVAWFSTLLPL